MPTISAPNYRLAMAVREQIEAMRSDKRHLLCIDIEKACAEFKFKVLHDGELVSVQYLEWAEVAQISRWIGMAGSKALLDEFEVALINCAVLRLHPWDEDGLRENSYEAMCFEQHRDGRRIRWIATCLCPFCGAKPLIVPGEIDAWCGGCSGTGTYYGGEILSDLDGRIVNEGA
jgi:hypothetical protein